MKVLITGGSGLLGQYLNIELSKEHELLSLYNSNAGNCTAFNSVAGDISDQNMLRKIFVSFKPDVVVHTAAVSRPELCDILPREKVMSVNVDSVKCLAELCEENSSKLIFTSTDLVYDGEQGSMLKESASINPVSLYAETKVMSEEIIRKTFENYLILRTSLLFGLGLNHSVNNFHLMFNNFLLNKKAKLFYDQYRTPLSLLDAARLVNQLLKLNLKNVTLNFGGKERVSRTDLGEILCRIGKFDLSLIDSISMNDIPALHKVADVSMDTTLLQSFGLNQMSVEESVQETIGQVRP